MQIFKLLFLCTGNAARSVMAKAMLDAMAEAPNGKKSELTISSAGTMVIENLPSSRRVERALREYGLTATGHRSRQFTKQEADWADLIVGFEPHHIMYIRKNHSEASHKAAMLNQLINIQPSMDTNLRESIMKLGLDKINPEDIQEVVDPDRGGDLEMAACAREISKLLDVFWKNWRAKITS